MGVKIISKTKNTPEVILDLVTPIIKIVGASYPEDATTFYIQILEWIDENTVNFTSELTCEFDYFFFSSSSHKMVYQLLLKLENLQKNGTKVKVIWYYEETDEDLEEIGMDFKEKINLPVTLIAKEECDE